MAFSIKMIWKIRKYTLGESIILIFIVLIALLYMIKEIENSLKLCWKKFFLQLTGMILKESYVFVKFPSSVICILHKGEEMNATDNT